MAESEHPRAILKNFLSMEECKELEFIHKSCSAVGYRPNVFSTTLSHLIATNSSHFIVPFAPIRGQSRGHLSFSSLGKNPSFDLICFALLVYDWILKWVCYVREIERKARGVFWLRVWARCWIHRINQVHSLLVLCFYNFLFCDPFVIEKLWLYKASISSWTRGASIGWHSDDNRPYLKQRDFAVCIDYGYIYPLCCVCLIWEFNCGKTINTFCWFFNFH